MRYLAIARYRFLLSVRAASWVLAVCLAFALLFLGATQTLFAREDFLLRNAANLLRMAASLFLTCYAVHTVLMFGAATSFGTVRRNEDESEKQDLFDTVPLLPRHRFVGDALGIFAAVMTLHLCTLPLLALLLAAGPLPTAYFVYAELTLMLLAILTSACGSWQLRARSSRWSRTRLIRGTLIFHILFILILVLNTRWIPFLNAFALMLGNPSAQRFSDIAAAVRSPALLAVSLATLYLGFLSFFYFHSTRAPEHYTLSKS